MVHLKVYIWSVLITFLFFIQKYTKNNSGKQEEFDIFSSEIIFFIYQYLLNIQSKSIQ